MSDQGFFELVWENGQLVTRGFPERSENSRSGNIGYSFRSSNARLKNGRSKFVTSDSIVDDSHNTNSVPNDNEPVLRELFKTHFSEYFSELNRGNNISYDHKLLKDSQVVPVHETAPTADNSQVHQFSLQQHNQVSTPLKRPRVKSSSNLFSMGVLSNPKTLWDHKDLEPERKKETVNFSLFLRSPAVPTSPTRGFSRAEKLQTKPVLLAPAANGSRSVKGSQNQLDSMDTTVEPLQPGANKSVPDVQSEAVNAQTSCLPAANTEKGKLDAGKCKEPQVPSSSLCSLGASNNPTYNTFKRRYEDTEGSACPSDHNEEKPERKAVPARSSKSNKRKRTPEVHNLSERRRRDKINKKMRALQELIPNCNKVDKASMLDEAIEYLKTLQFQVKMMSMGSGVCMPPMMLPTGIQQMHAPQMSPFSPMGIGMGMRMQMGVGCNPAQFLIPPIARPTAVPGIYPETRIPMPGFPGHQPLPISMLHAQLGLMHKTDPIVDVLRADAAPVEPMDSSLLTNSKDSVQNVHVNQRNVDRSKI